MNRIKSSFVNYKVFAAAFSIGCLVAFGHAPWGYIFISIIGLIGLFALTTYCKSESSVMMVFGFGLGYFSLTLHWLVEPFLVEAKYYFWLAPFGYFSLVIICSSIWALSTFFVLSVNKHSSSLNIAFSLTLGEFLRSYIFSGFPWGLVGYIWLDTPIAQLSAWIGPLGLTGLTLLASGMFFSIKDSFKVIFTLSGIFLISVILYFLRYDNVEKLDNFEQLSSKKIVRIVQPNAIQHKKWDPRFAPVYFGELISLSSHGSNNNLDLVVWPETAIVPWLDEASEELKRIRDTLNSETDLILGIRRSEKNKIFNSMILLTKNDEITVGYDKHHLVPFGEYIPLLKFLSEHNIINEKKYGDFGFSAGSGSMILSSKIGDFRPLICYEAIFFQEIDNENRPEFLVNLTNDGWLGSWAGPQQHLQQVRMRAIEQGLPIIRSANTGISAVIDPSGKIIKSIPINSAGYIDVELPLSLDATLYAKNGEGIFLIWLFAWSYLSIGYRKLFNS